MAAKATAAVPHRNPATGARVEPKPCDQLFVHIAVLPWLSTTWAFRRAYAGGISALTTRCMRQRKVCRSVAAMLACTF